VFFEFLFVVFVVFEEELFVEVSEFFFADVGLA
jgi:hypothetical protein